VTRTATVVPNAGPVDCVVSAWSMQSATQWSACTAGQQTRTETWTRTIVTPPSNGGAACGPLTEQRTGTQSCTMPPTATFTGTLSGTNTAVLTWQTTGATSVTINGAAKALSGSEQHTISAATTYTLVATGPGGSVTRTATVTPNSAPVDCVLSAWSMQSATAWGVCTAGQQTRTETWTRTIVTPPANGGAACGPLSEQRTGTQSCTMPPTATFTGTLSGTNTAVLTWQTTGATSVTINGQARALSGTVQYTISTTTTYTLVATGAGGSVTRTATVAPNSGPVDCVVTAWSLDSATPWGACTAGQQTRTETWTRAIVTQPVNGGAACGPLTEQRTATRACAMPPTATFTGTLQGTNTAALNWQTTGATSVTINNVTVALSGSVQYTIDAATTYSLVATGPGGSVTRDVTVAPQPVDCVVSAWSFHSATQWGACIGGQQSRTETWMRTIITSPAFGGLACGPLQEERIATQSCTAAPTEPGPPVNLQAQVSGTQVTVTWSPNPAGGAPNGYLISGGTLPGLSDLANRMSVGNTLSVRAVLPRGTYYARVRAANAVGVSGESSELVINVGERRKPRRPGALSGSLLGHIATLAWAPPAAEDGEGDPSGYVIEAGSAAGLSNLAVVPVGDVTSFQAVSVPPGVYYVRVRAVNEMGSSDPSNEIVLSSAQTIGPPLGLTESGTGAMVSLAWQAPGVGDVPTGYLVEAGSGPGLADLAVLRLGNTNSFATTAPPGVYYVRVRAVDASGRAGEASNEVIVRR
jgi:hypothetical protein